MKRVELGHSGIEVTELGYGCMMFGPKLEQEEAFAQLDAYLERGGNLLDTANIYGRRKIDGTGRAGRSEEIIGAWLKERGCRDQVVLASKVGFAYPGISYGTSARQIREECEKSLQRLQTDYLDLYYLHTDDENTPLEETLSAMDTLVREGKVRAIGASNFSAWRLERARQICQANHWTQICCIQQRYSYLRPKQDAVFPGQKYVVEDLREYIRDTGITLLAYCPLLKGAYVNPEKPFMAQYVGADAQARLAALDQVARETGYSKVQIVYYWLMHQDPAAIPLVTTTNMAQFEEAMGTLKIQLSKEQLDFLSAAGEGNVGGAAK